MTRGGRGTVRRFPCTATRSSATVSTLAIWQPCGEGLRAPRPLPVRRGRRGLVSKHHRMLSLTDEKDLLRIPDPLPVDRTNLMTIHLFSSCPMGEDRKRCVADSFGRVHGHPGLLIADASLLPGPPGRQPAGSVMAIARRNAMHFLGPHESFWRKLDSRPFGEGPPWHRPRNRHRACDGSAAG